MLSDNGYREARRILSAAAKIDGQTQLLPDTVCDAVVCRIDGEPQTCTPQQAAALAADLISHYPDLVAKARRGENRRDMTKIIDAFAASRPSVCMAVIESRPALPPKPADVAKAIAAEQARLALIRANALAHKAERARRLAQQAEDEAWRRERERVPAAERAARANALVAAMKARAL